MRSTPHDDGDFMTAAAAMDARLPVEWAPYQHHALALLADHRANLISAGHRTRLWRLAMGQDYPSHRDLQALETVSQRLWGAVA